MTHSDDPWHVLPHGKLNPIDRDIMTVVGEIRMPLTTLPRRMTVVRLRDSRLVVWSAIALDDEEMAKLEAFGRPAFLVVPNSHHRLDACAWKLRYPDMQVVAPQGSRAKIAEVVKVDTTTPHFDDDRVQFVAVPGTREREAALIVRTAGDTTLVLNDLVGNIRRAPGIGGWFLRLVGFAGRVARVPKIAKLALINDADALRGQLLQWSEIDSLRRIVVSHGDPIETNPRQTLRDLAASLA